MYLSGASRESKWDEDARALREDGVVAGCSRVDDTPMTHVRLCRYTQTLKLIHHNTTLASLAQQVRLPFTFLFAGKRFRHAYLNANGGLFFDPAPPCGQYFAAGQPCSLTTSKPNSFYRGYKNLIAGLVADLNPADSEESTIKYSASNQKLLVEWSRMSLYGSSWRGYSFTVEIRVSGTIVLHLSTMKPPDLVPDAPHWSTGDGWVVGLRFDEPQANRTAITEQQAKDRATWLSGQGDDSYGIYVNRSLVSNNTRFTFCPISVAWCLSPASASTAWQTAPEGNNITLSAPSFGCEPREWAFRCGFVPMAAFHQRRYSQATVLGSDYQSLDEKTSEEHLSARLTCAFPPGGLAPGNYSVVIEYALRIDEDKSDYSGAPGVVLTPLAWQPMHNSQIPSSQKLEFTSFAGPRETEAGEGETRKEEADKTTTCQAQINGTMGCDSCGVCGGVNLCLGCDGEDPYTEVDCSGGCDGQGDFVEDLFGTCCLFNATDCLGQCGGSFSEGWSRDGSYRVCCDDIACDGFCGGRAWIDQCNVCSGGESGHRAESDKDCDGKPVWCYAAELACGTSILIIDLGRLMNRCRCSGVCFGSATCAPTPVSIRLHWLIFLFFFHVFAMHVKANVILLYPFVKKKKRRISSLYGPTRRHPQSHRCRVHHRPCHLYQANIQQHRPHLSRHCYPLYHLCLLPYQHHFHQPRQHLTQRLYLHCLHRIRRHITLLLRLLIHWLHLLSRQNHFFRPYLCIHLLFLLYRPLTCRPRAQRRVQLDHLPRDQHNYPLRHRHRHRRRYLRSHLLRLANPCHCQLWNPLLRQRIHQRHGPFPSRRFSHHVDPRSRQLDSQHGHPFHYRRFRKRIFQLRWTIQPSIRVLLQCTFRPHGRRCFPPSRH